MNKVFHKNADGVRHSSAQAASPLEVPPGLEKAILAGRCVAFVGAGFAMPVVPSWKDLLLALAAQLDRPITIKSTDAFTLEAIGQRLKDAAEAAHRNWKQLVSTTLDELARDNAHAGLDERCRWLLSIPFKAILTTNFDGSLAGNPTTPATYRAILRDEVAPGTLLPTQLDDAWPTPPVIKLHGCVRDEGTAGLVFSRRDYRALVHGDGRYPNFLRAVFAGYTVLFLGVSFTDAYLNELRAETLTLLDPAAGSEPWGYALKIDTEPEVAEFFAKHEAIELLPANDASEFDAWLRAIAERTSVKGRLRRLLAGKRIVWVDAHPENNALGRALFRDDCGAEVIDVRAPGELADAHAGVDLLITHFGAQADQNHRAHQVLRRANAWTSRPPVIVFAAPGTPAEVQQKRMSCLRRGAFEYATEWPELYRLIESLFGRIPGES